MGRDEEVNQPFPQQLGVSRLIRLVLGWGELMFAHTFPRLPARKSTNSEA